MKTLKDRTSIAASDVVLVCLDPAIGAEKKKTRPCLVVEAGGSPLELAILLPITDGVFKNSKTFAPIDDLAAAGLTKDSVVDCYQIRAVALERIVKKLGCVDKYVMFDVRERLAKFLDIGEEHCS